MKKYIKRGLCILLSLTFAATLASCAAKPEESEIKSLFTNTEKVSFSGNYTELTNDKKYKAKS